MSLIGASETAIQTLERRRAVALGSFQEVFWKAFKDVRNDREARERQESSPFWRHLLQPEPK